MYTRFSIPWMSANPTDEIFYHMQSENAQWYNFWSNIYVRQRNVQISPTTSIISDKYLHSGIWAPDNLHSSKQWELDIAIAGYRFSHSFLEDWSTETQAIGSMIIDENAVYDTMHDIWEDTFKQFEKSIWRLFFAMSHDYTLHGLWLNVNDHKDFIDDIIRKRVMNPLDETMDVCEYLSFMFHGNFLQHFAKLDPGFNLFLKKHIAIVVSIMESMSQSDIKRYWQYVLRYIIFSIFSLQDVLDISSNLKPLSWQHDIHAKWVKTLAWDDIDVSILREAVVIAYTSSHEKLFEILQA